jgi:hypothetical protein
MFPQVELQSFGHEMPLVLRQKIRKESLFAMCTFLVQFLLGGCRHRPQSRPFTLDNRTYKVCLECGKVIYYSLERMAPLSIREQSELRGKERVLSGRS